MDSSSPLISCIIPVFNGERFLQEALENVFQQSYRPIEIIVVDDGSTDGTKAVAMSFGEKVRYFSQTNSGPWVARNLGIKVAMGKFIAFLDADDLWHSDKLARQIARFRERPELGVSVTMVQNFWESEFQQEEIQFRDDRISQAIPGYTCPTMLARRNQFETVGLFNKDLRHAAATDWFLRAARKGTVVELLRESLLSRRLHESNRSRIHASNSRDEYLHILQTHLKARHREGVVPKN